MDMWMQIGVIASALGTIVAAVGVIAAAKQLKETKMLTQSEILLGFDIVMHNDENAKIHTLLRPGGSWSDNVSGPSKIEEWIGVERYLGTFERASVLIENETMKIGVFDNLYGYRLDNIRANRIIMKKVENEKKYWTRLLKLIERVDEHRKETQ